MENQPIYYIKNLSDINLTSLSKDGFTIMIPKWSGSLVTISYKNGVLNTNKPENLEIPKTIDSNIEKLIFIETISNDGVTKFKLINFISKHHINFKKFCDDYSIELLNLIHLKLGSYKNFNIDGIIFFSESGESKYYLWRNDKNFFKSKITKIEWIQNHYLVFTPTIYIEPISIRDSDINRIKINNAYEFSIRDLKVNDTINFSINNNGTPFLESEYPINCEDYKDTFILPKCSYCNKGLSWYNDKNIYCQNLNCSSYSKLILDIIAYHHIPYRMIMVMKDRGQYTHNYVKQLIYKLDKMTEDLLREPRNLLIALNIPKYSLNKVDSKLLDKYLSSMESIENIKKYSNMTPNQLEYFNRIISILKHYILEFYIKTIDKPRKV